MKELSRRSFIALASAVGLVSIPTGSGSADATTSRMVDGTPEEWLLSTCPDSALAERYTRYV
jgi:hypothetical protein